ncbi:dynein axonemal intermediate chain 3 [Lucilia cuprina]|uniref:dynein axonemal intermediate chain 3 n=1 Tax=Lucilia cuprina TaxID=7375 RepID=UPI001F06A4C5|nr:dynein axonemal intermediate chain 3 [Lucilia cuprina]
MAEITNTEEPPAEPVEDERTKFIRINRQVLQWTPPENEYELTESSYDINMAWDALLTLPTCQEMMIKEANQKLLNLVVGINVTQEFPWKQIPYKELRDNLFDDLSNGQLLHNAFQGYDLDSHVLVGYVPIITQDMEEPPAGDPFVLYVNPADAKLALAIIRNLETFERLIINKRLLRQPRKWVSFGSEDEVNLTIAQRYHEPVDVEIQSVYPLTIPANKEFSFRLTKDVRDGYVELIPAENARFENVSRRRITVGIQSSFPRIDIEQQTDPTFPTNAWAQYLYEIDEEDDCLDEESEEEESKEKLISKPTTPEPPKETKPPPEVSDNVKLLLKTLEFNQIDMYRNDYPYISDKCVMHYTSPYLEETLCFANIAKSHQRYVCGFDWYPALAGLIVTSYTFSTAATIESVSSQHDYIQRAVLETKPILMWSFSDNLNYKLEFESPLEVITLSFCPYEPNVLLGGATNGQIILWDLQDRAEKLDNEEMLSSSQLHYRVLMNEFLKWTIQINEKMLVTPATVSSLENSQKGCITAIYWLASHCFINTFGKLYTDPGKPAKYRYFMTSAMDGTIAFWNLDSQAGKKVSSGLRRDLPKELTQSESVYKGKFLAPIFTVVFNEPLTAVLADTPVFKCLLKEKEGKSVTPLYNYAVELEESEVPEIRQSCITASFYGRIERLTWLGLYADADGREVVNTSLNFARVHDGPVISMKRNPFFPWLFVSIGRSVFAVWKEDYNYSPIFWRKCQSDLTAVAWSESRPSVLFLTRIDGSLEAWDILSRDDEACLNDTLGGGIVTNICEHKPSEPEKLLGIGDYNSSLRMVKLPKSLYQVMDQEFEDMKQHILKEESRKKEIQAWEHKYYEKNKDFIETKLQAEREAHKEMERIEKEAVLMANRRAKEEEEAKKAAEPTTHSTYTERMKNQWYELNLNRLLGILMSRKRVNEKQLNEQTALEKERLAYELAKKQSLADVLKRVGDEVAAIRLRIYPQEIPDLQRNDMIQSSVDSIMQTVETYELIENEANDMMNDFDNFDNIDYAEFLHRGQERRKHLNKSLGGNTERWYWYETMAEENLIGDCDWGLETYADLLQNTDVGSLPPSELSLLQKQEDEGDQADGEGEGEGD